MNRPAFQEMMSEANKRKFDASLGWKLMKIIGQDTKTNCGAFWRVLFGLYGCVARLQIFSSVVLMIPSSLYGAFCLSSWGNPNMLGEYDFSEEKLQDSIGIKPPNFID